MDKPPKRPPLAVAALLTGGPTTAAAPPIIVPEGIAWRIAQASRAGEVPGRTLVGTAIILGAAQIPAFIAFSGATL